jgi:hypothetical protein
VELSAVRVIELEEQVKQRDELIDSPRKLESARGYVILKSQEKDESTLIHRLSTIAACSNCKVNFK